MACKLFVLREHRQRRRFLLERRRAASRVLKVGDEIKQLHSWQFTGMLQLFEDLFQMREINSIFEQPHTATTQSTTLRDAEVDEIGGVFHQHDVAFITKRFG